MKLKAIGPSSRFPSLSAFPRRHRRRFCRPLPRSSTTSNRLSPVGRLRITCRSFWISSAHESGAVGALNPGIAVSQQTSETAWVTNVPLGPSAGSTSHTPADGGSVGCASIMSTMRYRLAVPVENTSPMFHGPGTAVVKRWVDQQKESEIVAPMRRAVRGRTLLVGLMLLVGAAAVGANAGSQSAAGTLNMNGNLTLKSVLGDCPSGVSASSTCADRTSTGPFAGLGQVTGTYTFLLDTGPCDIGLSRASAYPVRFSVAAKGEIDFQLAAGAECLNEARAQTQTFTVTGGTGIYAGASGTGTVTRRLGATSYGSFGSETWTGTLAVAGLDFDVTRPTLAGATNKTVRARKGAKSARVAFRVTAQDERDGRLPVACLPRSGSRFRIGRTRVTCSSIDGSANTAKASFTVTVRPTK